MSEVFCILDWLDRLKEAEEIASDSIAVIKDLAKFLFSLPSFQTAFPCVALIPEYLRLSWEIFAPLSTTCPIRDYAQRESLLHVYHRDIFILDRKLSSDLQPIVVRGLNTLLEIIQVQARLCPHIVTPDWHSIVPCQGLRDSLLGHP